jgi:hypothetical protein
MCYHRLTGWEYGFIAAAIVGTNIIRKFLHARIRLMVAIGKRGRVLSPVHDIRLGLGNITVSSSPSGGSGVFQYDFRKGRAK